MGGRPRVVLAMAAALTPELFGEEERARLAAVAEVLDAEPLARFDDERAARLLAQAEVLRTAGADLMKVYKGTSILMLAIVITTALVMIFPQIALWLPATMR